MSYTLLWSEGDYLENFFFFTIFQLSVRYIVVGWICEKNCAFYDKSMKLGIMARLIINKNFEGQFRVYAN